MKVLLDLIAKIFREDVLKLPVRKEHFHEISNDNGIINFATSKNLQMNAGDSASVRP
jgi:hypothetical protein